MVLDELKIAGNDMLQRIRWCVATQVLLFVSSVAIAGDCDMPEMPRFPAALESHSELDQFNSEMDGYRDSAKQAIQCLVSDVVERGGPGIPETQGRELDVRKATEEMKRVISRANALVGRFHAAQVKNESGDESNDE